MAKESTGKVVQVIGPVIDVEFEEDGLPEIYNALTLDETVGDDIHIKLTAEVAQHLGRNQVQQEERQATEVTAALSQVEGASTAAEVG